MPVGQSCSRENDRVSREKDMQIRKFALVLCLLFYFQSAEAAAQAVRVGQGGARPAAILGGSVTVTAAPAFVNFRLISNGVAASSTGVGVTTTWTGLRRLCKFNLYGYFSGADAALSGGSPPVNIPTSAVLGQVPTGSPLEYTPFTQSNPVGGASLLLYCELFMIGGNGNRTDTLNMEINLEGLPQLPAGTYTGTLYLQAQML
jgi:hypothetical protein